MRQKGKKKKKGKGEGGEGGKGRTWKSGSERASRAARTRPAGFSLASTARQREETTRRCGMDDGEVELDGGMQKKGGGVRWGRSDDEERGNVSSRCGRKCSPIPSTWYFCYYPPTACLVDVKLKVVGVH